MHGFKRVIVGVFLLLLVLAVLAFVLENQQSATLLFLGWAAPQLPISFILVLVLLIGMVIGPVIAWFLGRPSRTARNHLV
jgi:putative membrane protein